MANALRLFKKAKKHMALVRDQEGQILGMITLEDILEEIIGDIEDEQDAPLPPKALVKLRRYRPRADRTDRKLARTNCNPVKMDSACAALSDTTAELRTSHPEDIAQHPQERHVLRYLDTVMNAVYFQIFHGRLRSRSANGDLY